MADAQRSSQSDAHRADRADEQTPLLPRSDNQQATEAHDQQEYTSTQEGQGSGKRKQRRWPSLVALLALCVVAILIMLFAFLAPSIAEQYAQQAITFEPTSLSIAGFTSSGVQARVRGDFMMDGSMVQSKPVRDLGRFSTWIVRKVESGESKVVVSLPEYGNVVLGVAYIPPIVVDVRDGKTTHVEFYTDLEPGDLDGVRRIASDWIDGRLGQLRVVGKADVPIKSGIFSFGTQTVTHELLFDNKDIPTIPAYKIKKLNIHDGFAKGVEADLSLEVRNPYPVALTVPPMSFDVLVNGCQSSDPNIMVAEAVTQTLDVVPNSNIELNVTGLIRKLPETLVQTCPGSNDSPLDLLVGRYIRGKKMTVYVKGSDQSKPDTPGWVKDILSSVTVPVAVPGKSFGHLIKNFSTAETHFSLPEPWAEPGTPAAHPRISAVIQALIALPEEMNFNLAAEKVRANATIYYKGKQLGTIDIPKWQPAKSTRLPPDAKDDSPSMLVESRIKDIPVNITDDDLFTDVLTELILGSKGVNATLEADVDVGVNTALGQFAIRKIPAAGQVPLKPISSGRPDYGNATSPEDMLKSLNPRIYNISIVSSTPSALTISALVNITNPTEYEADIPYLSLHALTNNSILANASVTDMKIKRGNNTGLKAVATWSPADLNDDKKALRVGIAFISQYISGYNTSLTVKLHKDSIPALPGLSRALSKVNVTMPTPRLDDGAGHGGDDDDDGDGGDDQPRGPKFIDEARFHLWSSTADFILRSPLPHDIMTITSINATARYKGSRIGQIDYDEPFEVAPVDESGEGSLTPRLPVVWETGGVGWDAVRKAIGGKLKVSAEAVIGVAIGTFRLDGVHFQGHGLGVGVRP